jgi:hypothetical protein
MVLEFIEFNNANAYEHMFFSFDAYYTITHYICTGINAQYNFIKITNFYPLQNKTKIKDKSVWRTIFIAAQWIVPMLIALLLYKKFFKNTELSLPHFIMQVKALPLSWYVLLFVASICNWSLETYKWQFLIRKINPLTFGLALRSILSGVAVAQLLPYKTGEYLGRLMYVKTTHRLNAGLLSVIGSYSQLLITLLLGIFSFVYLEPIALSNTLLLSISLAVVLGFLFYFLLPGNHFKWLSTFLNQALIEKLRHVVRLTTLPELLTVLLISALRYLTFLLPYALLAWHYGLSMEASFLHHIMAVSCIFFIQSVAPNFILTDVALRLTVPVLVFSFGNMPISGLEYVPGLLVYVFNVAVPMLIGAILIMFAKYKQA